LCSDQLRNHGNFVFLDLLLIGNLSLFIAFPGFTFILLTRFERIQFRKELVLAIIFCLIFAGVIGAALGFAAEILGLGLFLTESLFILCQTLLFALAFNLPIVILRGRNGRHILEEPVASVSLAPPKDLLEASISMSKRFLGFLVSYRWRIFASCAGLLIFIVLFYVEENWRGHKAWETYRTELESKGSLLDWDQFIPPEIPDEDNFWKAPMMEAWFKKTDQTDPTNEIEFPFKFHPTSYDIASLSYLKAPSDNMEGANYQEYIQWLNEFEDQWEILYQACLRPKILIPGDYSLPYHYPRIDFVRIRTAVQILASNAKARYLHEDYEGMMRDLFMIKRLALVSKSDYAHSLVEAMIHTAVVGLYASVLQEILLDGRIPLEFLKRIQDLTDFPTLNRAVFQSMQAERASVIHMLDIHKQLGLKVRGRAFFSKQKINPYGIFYGSDINEYNSYYSPLVSSRIYLLIPTGWISENQLNYCKGMDIGFFDLVDSNMGPVDLYKLVERKEKLLEFLSNKSPFRAIVRIALPNLFKANVTALKNEDLIRQLKIYLALEQYNRTNGIYPTNLDALIPDFLEEIPLDVFSRKPHQYRLQDTDHFILYSIGRNQKDDGGDLELDLFFAPPKQNESQTQ